MTSQMFSSTITFRYLCILLPEVATPLPRPLCSLEQRVHGRQAEEGS